MDDLVSLLSFLMQLATLGAAGAAAWFSYVTWEKANRSHEPEEKTNEAQGRSGTANSPPAAGTWRQDPPMDRAVNSPGKPADAIEHLKSGAPMPEQGSLFDRVSRLPASVELDDIRRRLPNTSIGLLRLDEKQWTLQITDQLTDASFYMIQSAGLFGEFIAWPTPHFSHRLASSLPFLRQVMTRTPDDPGILNVLAVSAHGGELGYRPLKGECRKGERVTIAQPLGVLIPEFDPAPAPPVSSPQPPASQPPPPPVPDKPAFDDEAFSLSIDAFWSAGPPWADLDRMIEQFRTNWQPTGVRVADGLTAGTALLRDATPQENQTFDEDTWSLWAVDDNHGRYFVIPTMYKGRLSAGSALTGRLKSSNHWHDWFALQSGDRFQVLAPAIAVRTASNLYSLTQKGQLQTQG